MRSTLQFYIKQLQQQLPRDMALLKKQDWQLLTTFAADGEDMHRQAYVLLDALLQEYAARGTTRKMAAFELGLLKSSIAGGRFA